MEIFISVLVRLGAAVILCLLPGSFVVIAVVYAWKGLRRLLGFQKPNYDTLRDVQGNVVYSIAEWHRATRQLHPVRYAIFERFPTWLVATGRRFKRGFSTPPARDLLLADAFETFVDWYENQPRTKAMQPVDGDDLMAERFNNRMSEIKSLYLWWTVKRPQQAAYADGLDDDIREFSLIDLELDDQHNLARLVNVWRDLV